MIAAVEDPDLRDEWADDVGDVESYPVELWIGVDDGPPVRMVAAVPGLDDRAGPDTGRERIDHTGWGEMVTVTAPADELISEFPR